MKMEGSWLCLLIIMLCSIRLSSELVVSDTAVHDRVPKVEHDPAIIKTIENHEDGEVFDCIDIYRQPAFSHPLLQNHTLETKPTSYPTVESEDSQSLGGQPKLEDLVQTVDCPEGTIPIRRTLRGRAGHAYPNRSLPVTRRVNNSIHEIRSSPGHENAQASLIGKDGIYTGVQGTLVVWNPWTEPDEYSNSQMWIMDRPESPTTTLIAGWHTLGSKFDPLHATRLFIYWTNDGYKSSGCYDLKCRGFIQVNNKIPLEGIIGPISSYKGQPWEVTLSITQNLVSGNWWFRFLNTSIGYWPESLVPNLRGGARVVGWGGEVLNRAGSDRHTTTQMGSGHFPSEGFTRAAYISRIGYVDRSGTVKQPDVSDLVPFATKPGCYDVQLKNPTRNYGTYFFFGGPGYSNQCFA